MITLYDPDPKLPVFPYLDKVGYSTIIPWVYGIDIRSLKPGELPEVSSSGSSIILREESIILNSLSSLLVSNYTLLIPVRLLDNREVDKFIKEKKDSGGGRIYLLHPWVFSPVFLNLAKYIRERRAAKGSLVIKKGRIATRFETLKGLLSLQEVLYLLAGEEGITRTEWNIEKRGVITLDRDTFVRGELEYEECKISFSLGKTDYLLLEDERGAREIALPEGNGLYYSLLDFSSKAGKGLDSEIFPPTLWNTTRNFLRSYHGG